jgi:energy-coupling factor transporter ATP-binding protein EcfA2
MRRHIAIVGKTGSGKSTFLYHLITGLIKEGVGVGLLDPHGDLLEDVLSSIPKERVEETVLIDPTDTGFPISFNALDSHGKKEQTVASIVDTFHTLFAESWGPRTEYILTHAVATLASIRGTSLLGIPKLLLDPKYRNECVSQLTDPILREFWVTEYKAMPARLRIESIAPILNKVNRFLMFPMMRNILGQRENRINLRKCMDSSKTVLINLPKGLMGEENSRLLGNFFLSHLKLAAFSRAEIPRDNRNRFVLVIDELQHFITQNSAQIETLLSEGRKYKLSLVVTCQHLSQLGQFTESLFGNVHTIAAYAVGHEDARKISEYFPDLKAQDVMNLPPYSGYIRLIRKSMPHCISFANIPHKASLSKSLKDEIQRHSRERYGRPKEIVEAEIHEFFKPQIHTH